MTTRLDLEEIGTGDGHEPSRAGRGPRVGGGSAAWRRPRLVGAVVALALVSMAGVWAYRSNVTSGKPAMDMSMRVASGGTPFPVTAATVERGPVGGAVVYTGSVAPLNEEDIYPRVTGRIVELPVYPGDAVRAGQVVAQLDDVELGSRVREAAAMAATSRANRTQMEADVTAARHGVVQMERELAMIEAELEYARAVAGRAERLFQAGAVSRQEYESDRTMAVSAGARGEAARAKLDQARAMEESARRKLEAAGAMVAQGEAVLHTAEIVRSYATIVAPSSGYVVKRLVAPGVLVQPGMPILKLAQIDRVRLQANVGEKDLAAIRVGSPVTASTAAGGEPVTARVTAVFPFVEGGGRTAVVEAVVDNPGRRFLPGQYVTMRFVTGERPQALSVPRGAVASAGGRATVWIIDGERVQPREVTTGLETAERVEIVGGLAAGDRVIARGHEGLYAGARVREVASAPAPSAPPPTPKEGAHAGH